MKNILIKNGLVLTQNSDRDIIYSDVLVENGKIKQISNNITFDTENTIIIDATNKLVMPGLVNCHLHSDAYMYKGLGDDLRLFEQFKDPLLNKIWDTETKEQLYIGALGTYCECIKNGITFVNDFPFSQFFVKELVIAMRKCKLRGAITNFDFTNEAHISNETFIKLCQESSIIPVITLPSEESLSEKKLDELKNFTHLIRHGHILECRERLELINNKLNKSTIMLLEEKKLLDSKTHIVHGNQLNNMDINFIAKNKSKIIITPSSELKVQDGTYDVQKVMNKNILFGVGTDGAIWNNSNDLFRESKILLLNQKSLYGVNSLNSQKVLDMITIDGAKCFGLDKKIGSIEKDKDADIILLELNSFNLSPIILEPKNNVVSNIVYCATGNDVTHTIICGELLMENRRLLHINETDLLNKIKTVAKDLMISIQKLNLNEE